MFNLKFYTGAQSHPPDLLVSPLSELKGTGHEILYFVLIVDNLTFYVSIFCVALMV